MKPPIAKSFRAALERMNSPLKWVIIRIPFDVTKTWGARGRLKVRGDINGHPFRSSLFPSREGLHYLLVNKRMQAGAHVSCGATAKFNLEPDTAERVASVPKELDRFFKESRTMGKWYNQLNYSARKSIADWITEVKTAEARERRAEQVAERLMATMEAERELPPILQLAFAQDPRAREGWNRMSSTRRRGQLLAIFYYRSPDARARRVAKVVQEAVEFAERKLSNE